MKIIAIEGLDKSGKASQVRMLTERLQNEGLKVVQSEFHRYDQPTGDLVMKWLTKKWDVDQKTIEFIMLADKQSQQSWFKQLEQDGVEVLILDRYTLSQFVYAKANGVDIDWLVEMQRYMRQPDVNIVIDIPADVSMGRKGKHNDGQNDRYESDVRMLSEVRNNYLQLLYIVSAEIGYTVNGEDSIENIHSVIYEIVRGELDGAV